jgi:hypothetical protein
MRILLNSYIGLRRYGSYAEDYLDLQCVINKLLKDNIDNTCGSNFKKAGGFTVFCLIGHSKGVASVLRYALKCTEENIEPLPLVLYALPLCPNFG